MEKLLDPIMKKLLDRGFVDDENAEIVRYGLELLIMKTIISAMMIATALITQSVPEVMVFVLSYALLRGCCGGYHAGSRIVCFILSMFLLSAVISAVKLIGGTAALFTSIGFICMGVVLILSLAPVDTPNKPFDITERQVFRKRSVLVSCAALLLWTVFAVFRLYNFALTVSAAVFITGLLLAAGRLKNRKGAAT
ncbi:MAG: accessory gene regulator B family protein [Ruminococcus sp.]|uniref:accessory gene regulator ArgB-like protein n=1 Tax=Ruminococcus sp. TaxID=41978 RepID=UPI0025CDA92C|nr:accessory gene regulator B family protein [Ruminococcus sp.]MBR5682396.1 accessory gene regulator B family protein [Ruminococcus sp.]